MNEQPKILKAWTETNPDGTTVKGYCFHCPGCKENHSVRMGVWSFNGSEESPTFNPSLLVKSGHYCDHHKPDDSCWCTFYADPENADVKERRFKCYICHSFIKDGMIQFLSDCTHELAGQTVKIPEWSNGDEKTTD